MSTPGEKNSYFPDASLLLREAYNAMYNKDEVVLEDSINNPSTNLLGADARGTVLGKDAHLADSQPDHPPPNLQQSTSSATKPVCRSKFCNNIGSIQRKDFQKSEKRAQYLYCLECHEKIRQNRNLINKKSRLKKKMKKQEVPEDVVPTSPKVEQGGGNQK